MPISLPADGRLAVGTRRQEAGGLDMRNQTLEFMQPNFGKAGAYYNWILGASSAVPHLRYHALQTELAGVFEHLPSFRPLGKMTYIGGIYPFAGGRSFSVCRR